MNWACTFFDPSDKIDSGSISAAMLFSDSPEELLKTFLTSIGEHLAVSRVAIYQLTNQDEGTVLVEAVSPNIQNIKNQTFSISCFGVDFLKEYRRNRPVVLSDITQIPEPENIHPCWQQTQVKAMMSAPILFNSLTEFDKIWGLAFIQQCDRARQWQPQEAYFLYELSQVLGQCLQSWESNLRLPTPPKSLISDIPSLDEQSFDIFHDQEELFVKRVELSKEPEVNSSQPHPMKDEIAVSNGFILLDDTNEVLDRSLVKNNETSINQSVDIAMQRLDQKIQYNSNSYHSKFAQMHVPQNIYGVDLESVTIENILESDFTQIHVPHINGVDSESVTIEDVLESKYVKTHVPNIPHINGADSESATIEDVLESYVQVSKPEPTQTKVDYLQQRVGELLESMQKSLDEIALLQQQVQELTASQQEFRQMLLDLQSENLTQKKIRDKVVNMYLSFSSK